MPRLYEPTEKNKPTQEFHTLRGFLFSLTATPQNGFTYKLQKQRLKSPTADGLGVLIPNTTHRETIRLGAAPAHAAVAATHGPAPGARDTGLARTPPVPVVAYAEERTIAVTVATRKGRKAGFVGSTSVWA